MRSRICTALIPLTAAMLLGSGAALAEKSMACKADLTGDGVVNFADLAKMKSVFFQPATSCTTCGDGVAEFPEECDDGNLLDNDGCSSTCKIVPVYTPVAFPATGQTTCWNTAGAVIPCLLTGHDGELQKGAALAYVDNGDGTITDSNTRLMWEKLDDNNVGGIHDWDNVYTWSEAFSWKLAVLNAGGGFAGHTDWRVPNYKELISIVNLEKWNPAVSAAFDTTCMPGCTVTSCSCTHSSEYWSSSTYASAPYLAWSVEFNFANLVPHLKTDDGYHVRAVRGGP